MIQNTAKNIEIVRHKVNEALCACQRDESEVKIVAVSKRHSAESVVEAIMAGVSDIGENRVQEAVEKRPLVEKLLSERKFDYSGVRWHMIGQLQSNKTRKAAELFDVVQSVDSLKIAQRLSNATVELGKTLDIFVEVNTSAESSKSGVFPEQAITLVKAINTLPGMNILGLMTVGPLTDDENIIIDSFNQLRNIRDDILTAMSYRSIGKELSMGMSDDFPLAIGAGSTLVRIGTAIFGPRPG